jgi:c-di-AMP phosphodiesterase-like protein
VSIPLGIIGFVGSSLNLIVFGVMFYFGRLRIINETLNLSLQVSDIQKEHLIHFDLPHCILDGTGKILWFNDAFFDLLEDPKLLDKNILTYFSEMNADTFPTYEEPVELQMNMNEEDYRVVIHKHLLEVNTSSLVSELSEFYYFSLYFYNVTKEQNLMRVNEEQKVILGYIYVDNYDDVLDSIEDVRRPLLIALIDRNLNKFIKSVNGVLRKVEKDKYIVFFQNKYMAALENVKFSVLDDIRGINIGNELPVTISIGLGIHEDDYTLSQDYARVAIDLALGRGGDQAVIKHHDKYSFYGGKTRGVETHTRVKARIKSYAFKELLNESDNIIIMGHRNQDLDSLGAAIGVFACARMLEKEVHIVIDDVSSAVKALYDRVMESPNFPDDIFITGSKAIEYTDQSTTLVIVDVNRPSYLEYPELLKHTRKLVVFDHHRVSTEFIENPVLSYIEPYASSTCEMVTEILRYISDKVKLDPIEADALFAGISVDTKNFIIKVGVKTFEAAAFLRRNGADVIRVRKFFKNDMATYKARASAVRDAIIYRDKMAISKSPSDVENPTLVAAQAADELLNISGIKASFVLTNVNGVIYVSARSFDEINVQLIMEKLGGGGHLSVAGAQLESMTIEEAIQKLKFTIDEYIEEGVKE